MNKNRLLSYISLFCLLPGMISCTHRELIERVPVQANITFTSAEDFSVVDGTLLLFDSGGILRHTADIPTAVGIRSTASKIEAVSGSYTVIAILNRNDHFTTVPEVMVAGETSIGNIKVTPIKSTDKDNPHLWFGSCEGKLHPGQNNALCVELRKTAGISIGIIVNPWNHREVDVEL